MRELQDQLEAEQYFSVSSKHSSSLNGAAFPALTYERAAEMVVL